MAKNNNENSTKKFKFGRNPLSLIIIILAIVIIFFAIYIPSSYIGVYNSNHVTAFESSLPESDNYKIEQTKERNVQRIKAKDFDVLDLNFRATSYSMKKDSHDATKNPSVSFKLSMYWTDKTTELFGDHFLGINYDGEVAINNTQTIRMAVCLATPEWIGYCNYSSDTIRPFSNKYVKSAESSKDQPSESSYTINGNISSDDKAKNQTFPATANTWPVKVSVDNPNAYLFIQFFYPKDGVKEQIYIIEYTYDEYVNSDTTII